ncbi:hypothetical protein [Massilia rubra]|uniref:Uncharacterized protein n=1 Tax=Massilia rubra TaxID=2607910 RepID=A0ABX0LM86_9BURK|nr:hypothetical protein [Massilia rubra]NHZ35966.1 hypothetical protein [Massilia rubra]
MTKPRQRRALSFLLIMLVASACSDKAREMAPAIQASAAPAVPTARAGKPGLPDIDLWAPILAAAAGNYDTQCESMKIPPDPVPKKLGPLIVTADGTLRAGSVTADLRRGTVASIGLSREVSGEPLLSVSVHVDSYMFGIAEFHDGVKRAGVADIECRLATKVRPGTRSIYAQYAGLLDAKARMTCQNRKTRKSDTTDYAIANGVLTIGATSYDLSTLENEDLIIKPEKSFSYSGTTPDDRSFSIGLDSHGKVSYLEARKKGSTLVECDLIP